MELWMLGLDKSEGEALSLIIQVKVPIEQHTRGSSEDGMQMEEWFLNREETEHTSQHNE